MGKLTLYGFEPSIPVRPVRLTLAALQLPYDFVVVNPFKSDQMSEEYKKKNPQHTIPLLEDDGALIWDSHAIICYLVSKYGKDDSLYPKDLLKRAVVDQRLHFESGVVFAGTLRATGVLLFSGVKELSRERVDAFIEVYDFMESFLKEHDYVAGDSITIADFSLIASISSAVVFVEVDAAKWPKLSVWMKRMEKLPYYEENARGAQIYIDLFKGLQFTVAK